MSFNIFKRKSSSSTNDNLLNAITVMATADTAQSYRDFYAAILKSILLLARENNAPSPILLEDPSGKVILPVFTDLERLKKVFPDARQSSMMSAPDIFNIALKNSIYRVNINPEYGPGGFLERYELEALAKGEIPELRTAAEPSLGEPNFIPTGNPKLPPQEVLDKMTETAYSLLKIEPSIDEGYIILTKSDKGESRLTIALHFNNSANEDDKAAFSQRFVLPIEAIIGKQLNLLWLEGERYKAVKSVVEPFYKREAK